MNETDLTNRLRTRLARMLVLRKSIAFLTAWCFAWGILMLAARFAGVESAHFLASAGVAGCVVAVVAAVVIVLKSLPDTLTLRALLDRDAHAGGLVMAADEADLGSWRSREIPDPGHAIRWRAGRPAGVFAVSILFAWSSLLIPSRFVRANPPLDIGEDARRLDEQIETLKNEDVIDLRKAEMLEEQLQEIRQDAEGSDPARAWEALDHLEESIDRTAASAAEDALRETESLTKLESFSEALADASSSLDPAELAKGMGELAKMAEQEAKKNGAFAKQMSPELAKAVESGTLSKEQMEQLAKSAGMTKEQLQKSLEKMHQKGLTDRKTLEKQAALGAKGDTKALSDFLKENGPKEDMATLVNKWCEGKGPTGKGGIDRGPGHAPLPFDGQTADDGAKFKELTLPESAIPSTSVSFTIATSPGMPDAPGQAGSTGGVLSGAAAGGGSAVRQPVMPRHKETVNRYFERKQK